MWKWTNKLYMKPECVTLQGKLCALSWHLVFLAVFRVVPDCVLGNLWYVHHESLSYSCCCRTHVTMRPSFVYWWRACFTCTLSHSRRQVFPYSYRWSWHFPLQVPCSEMKLHGCNLPSCCLRCLSRITSLLTWYETSVWGLHLEHSLKALN